jgi:hypothetical protein
MKTCCHESRSQGSFHSYGQIIKKLRRRLDTRDEQMVSRPCAGDIEQVALGIIDFLQIRIVADRLDALLQGNYSSSQAITTTARNSKPLARCMVLIETCPWVVSTCSSRILKARPAAFTAARARSSCSADRTNTPNSCGSTPAAPLYNLQDNNARKESVLLFRRRPIRCRCAIWDRAPRRDNSRA